MYLHTNYNNTNCTLYFKKTSYKIIENRKQTHLPSLSFLVLAGKVGGKLSLRGPKPQAKSSAFRNIPCCSLGSLHGDLQSCSDKACDDCDH